MKKHTIIFWITTTIIFLFEGVLVALTSQSEMAKAGFTGLGYPIYFGTLLAIFKVVGTIILMVPKFSPRIKEWAYAGFAFDFVFAFLSILIVGGVSIGLVLPAVFIILLILSYRSYHKLLQAKIASAAI
jgi:hypothetical protein